ncbi:polyphenol oxidase family protein [Candidatus Saccharibacteria bacterium]|nr:polyphenol oxidase family protein [Candidatus Saccharibacteria bacterium]
MEPVTIKTINNAVRIGYSGKKLGNTNERFGADAEANFARFTSKFPGKIIYDMPAVGKDNIVDVDDLTPEQVWETPADGLITRRTSALLVLKAADCIPLVFYVPGQNVLALAHVGTGGAALHLPSKMVKELNLPSDSLRVYVGPHVSQKSYHFPDKDLSDKKLDPGWDKYITHEADGIHIDLLGYVLDELKECGIKPKNIEVDDIDTGADPNYFSHRRHKITGEPNGRNCFGACLM